MVTGNRHPHPLELILILMFSSPLPQLQHPRSRDSQQQRSDEQHDQNFGRRMDQAVEKIPRRSHVRLFFSNVWPSADVALGNPHHFFQRRGSVDDSLKTIQP